MYVRRIAFKTLAAVEIENVNIWRLVDNLCEFLPNAIDKMAVSLPACI